MGETCLDQVGRVDLKALEEEAEALEHCAVAELLGVADKEVVVSVFARGVGAEDVGNVADATADRGVVEHIRTIVLVGVGDIDPLAPAPHSAGAEDSVGLAGHDAELGARDGHLRLPLRLRNNTTQDRTEQLSRPVSPQCSHALQPPM